MQPEKERESERKKKFSFVHKYNYSMHWHCCYSILSFMSWLLAWFYLFLSPTGMAHDISESMLNFMQWKILLSKIQKNKIKTIISRMQKYKASNSHVCVYIIHHPEDIYEGGKVMSFINFVCLNSQRCREKNGQKRLSFYDWSPTKMKSQYPNQKHR